MAFYEFLGKEGFDLLEKTIEYIPKDIIVILDGKRNDIGNTARKYAQSLFETFGVDAVTINPFLGKDGIVPFLEYKNKCSFILCRTSNPSAIDFQDLKISNQPLYELVAKKIKEWNTFGNCGAVDACRRERDVRCESPRSNRLFGRRRRSACCCGVGQHFPSQTTDEARPDDAPPGGMTAPESGTR